jgi:hypothetical protein
MIQDTTQSVSNKKLMHVVFTWPRNKSSPLPSRLSIPIFIIIIKTTIEASSVSKASNIAMHINTSSKMM